MPRALLSSLVLLLVGCPDGGGSEPEGSTGAESSSTSGPSTSSATLSSSSGASTSGSESSSDASSSSEASSGSSDGSSGSSSSDTDASSGSSESSSTGIESCPGAPDEVWYGNIPPELVTDEPYDFDAGLAAVIAAMPEENETVDLSADPLIVTGAVVAIQAYTPGEFWIADANEHVHVYLPFGVEIEGLETGDAVDLEVTALENYFGDLEITGIASASITATDQPVWVQDGSEMELTVAEHQGQVFTLWGELTEELGTCGGNHVCYTYSHCGYENVIRLNTVLGDWALGDVVQVAAPLVPILDDPGFTQTLGEWMNEVP